MAEEQRGAKLHPPLPGACIKNLSNTGRGQGRPARTLSTERGGIHNLKNGKNEFHASALKEKLI